MPDPGPAAPVGPVSRAGTIEVENAMALAVELAQAGALLGNEPIGAVVLDARRQVVGARHDEVEYTGDPTAHASVLALRDAAVSTGSWRLLGAMLVTTLEPCPLCAGAALSARVDAVVFGVPDLARGATGSRYHFGSDPRLNHEFAVESGVLAPECAALLSPSGETAGGLAD